MVGCVHKKVQATIFAKITVVTKGLKTVSYIKFLCYYLLF